MTDTQQPSFRLGMLVRFYNERNGGPVHRIASVMSDGMVELHDMEGYFAPHLFVIADNIAETPPTPTPDPALVERVWEQSIGEPTTGSGWFKGLVTHVVTETLAALRAAGWREATEPLPEDVEALKTKIDQIALDNPVGRIHDAIARQWLADRQRAVDELLSSIARIADDFIPDREADAGLALQEMREALLSLRARTRSAEVTNNGDRNV